MLATSTKWGNSPVTTHSGTIDAIRQGVMRPSAKGTRAVSVFLVNRREPEDAVEFKDRRFAFQAQLTLDSSISFVPRPNPKGRQDDEEWDERVANLQYRDVMEFAVCMGLVTTVRVIQSRRPRIPHRPVRR